MSSSFMHTSKRRGCACLAALAMKFFFDMYSFSSAGAVAALVQGLVVKELWKRGLPRALARAPGPRPHPYTKSLPVVRTAKCSLVPRASGLC